MREYSSDVAFTPAVKAMQARKGSRDAYAHVEENGGWRTEIDDKLKGFLAATDSFYLATATADGQEQLHVPGVPVQLKPPGMFEHTLLLMFQYVMARLSIASASLRFPAPLATRSTAM